MLQYILRRILISIPTLLIISLAVFGLSKCAPGDPVEKIFGEEVNVSLNLQQISANYQRKAAQLGFDKPLFYCSLSTAAFPDTLWKIYPLDRRDRLTKLTAQNGHWAATLAWESALQETLQTLDSQPDSLPQKPHLRLALLELSTQNKLENLEPYFQVAYRICSEINPQIPLISTRMDALRLATLAANHPSMHAITWLALKLLHPDPERRCAQHTASLEDR